MGEESSDAFFSLTQADYAAGNFRSNLLEGQLVASVCVASRTDNVAGVKLPVFTKQDTGLEMKETLGLAGGGRKIHACKEHFSSYLDSLIRLASLQTSFVAMDEALKVTNRRVNALENVTIPKINAILSMINRELDELEREDFTRLKKVQGKKHEKIKAEEERREAAAAAAGEASANGNGTSNGASSGDLLGGYDAADDDDVVFK